jgi:hypothetical protein
MEEFNSMPLVSQGKHDVSKEFEAATPARKPTPLLEAA